MLNLEEEVVLALEVVVHPAKADLELASDVADGGGLEASFRDEGGGAIVPVARTCMLISEKEKKCFHRLLICVSICRRGKNQPCPPKPASNSLLSFDPRLRRRLGRIAWPTPRSGPHVTIKF